MSLRPLLVCLLVSSAGAGEVTLLRTPENGLQPQAAIAADGSVHLLFYVGPERGGDLRHARLPPGASAFTPGVRVNSAPGSAIAMGTVRGGSLALGRDGSVQVAWNGAKTGLWHARSGDGGVAFSAQRDLVQWAGQLDGGGMVASDGQGRVLVAWHGAAASAKGEGQRQAVIALSTDDGLTFAREAPAWAEPTGACGCCRVALAAASDGGVWLAYRSAVPGGGRDLFLLSSSGPGKGFAGSMIGPWRVQTCPLSTAAIAPLPGGRALIAWQTGEQIHLARAQGGTVTNLGTAPGQGSARKHPALAVAGDGGFVLAWTEGTAWARGGSLAWQRYGADGRALGAPGRADGVPPWSLPTAVARGDGFVIVY